MKLALLAGFLMVLGVTGILVCTILKVKERYNEVEINYGIILDAGSSSTKAYIYEWEHKTTTSLPTVSISMSDDNVARMYKMKPGITTIQPNVSQVAAYLNHILEWASSIIPEDKIDSTPIYLQGTGAFRKLDTTTQGALLTSVRFRLQETDFLFKSEYASILTNTQEAGYGFVAVNGLYDNFDRQEDDTDSNLHGSLDMGGVSSVIAFISADEPPVNYTYQTEINGTTYTVYAASIDGLGINEARYAFNASILDSASIGTSSIVDPCAPIGYWENTTITVNGELRSFMLVGGSNDSECSRLVSNLVASLTANLPVPPLDNSLFVLSDHYLELKKFYKLKDNANIVELQAKTSSFCSLDYADAMNHHNDYASEVQNFCFMGRYTATLLQSYYGFDSTKRHLLWKDTIGGGKAPVTWTLGSMMEVVDDMPPDTSDQTRIRIVHFFSTPGGVVSLFISCLFVVMGIVLFILQNRRRPEYTQIR